MCFIFFFVPCNNEIVLSLVLRDMNVSPRQLFVSLSFLENHEERIGWCLIY